MVTEQQQKEILEIIKRSENKRGYGRITLCKEGALICFEGKKRVSEHYLSLFSIDNTLHFLARSPSEVSYDFTDEDEVKAAFILIQDTKKSHGAYIVTSTNADGFDKPSESDFAERYHCLTDRKNVNETFFLLVAFSEKKQITGFHFFGSTDWFEDDAIFNYSVQGEPPMNELKKFFGLLFSIFNIDSEKREQYISFIKNSFSEEE